MVRFICLWLLLSAYSAAAADEGDVMAVRVWPQNVVSIETNCGLRLAVNVSAETASTTAVIADRAVSLSEPLNHTLLRQPNQPLPAWRSAERVDNQDPNRIAVRSLGTDAVSLIADGVHIVLARPNAETIANGEQPRVDLLALVDRQTAANERTKAAAWIRSLTPRFVVVWGDKATDRQALRQFQRAIAADKRMATHDHNTFAISATRPPFGRSQLVVLADKSWKMPDDLAEEFAAMDQACQDAQQVFAKLSTGQMNFMPADGTHTPRWNAEHMMGRQLLFFSQIYHELDPTIPAIDLNPQQMPPDYVAAHPDWDGAEEARQMQRVSDFCRRFAYLLDELDLDQRAPGSRWPTLRALFVQMHRHYQEHTANTIKKFELPGWPKS